MTDEELYELVRKSYHGANRAYIVEQVSKACERCANNPKNGGGGACHCTIGIPVISAITQ